MNRRAPGCRRRLATGFQNSVFPDAPGRNKRVSELCKSGAVWLRFVARAPRNRVLWTDAFEAPLLLRLELPARGQRLRQPAACGFAAAAAARNCAGTTGRGGT